MMVICDAILVAIAYFFAYVIRFDWAPPAKALAIYGVTVLWIVPLKIVCLYFFGAYKGMWRYTSLYDLLNILKACTAALAAVVLVILFTTRFEGFSRGVVALDFILTFLVISAVRVLIRITLLGKLERKDFIPFYRKKALSEKKVLIVGAGNTGEKLLRETTDNPDLPYHVVGFVDDNPKKLNQAIHGVPVLGNKMDIPGFIQEMEIDEIIIAIPSATSDELRAIIDICKKTGRPFKTVPGIHELITNNVSVSAVRNVRYDDLLRRPAVQLDMASIGCYLSGKRVLVTGGAGSIGSELCRQIAAIGPRQLIIVERDESGLYDIEMDLLSTYPDLKTTAVLGSIAHEVLMARTFKRYMPEVVFHAAAYKHVPLMEVHPWQSVSNNIVGSHVIFKMCHKHHVKHCVLVSTDKAVRPTNVMGASKRFSELICQYYDQISPCKFVAVRFGNVLGSIGSVLPLFKKQIEKGGPVFVTHPEITRYFMTIPESVSLILQAGGLSNGSEIFVLKMGTPVKIVDMARDLIALSGFRPDVDIKIQYIGLRPGEKMYEELITKDEDIEATQHDDIMVLKNGHRDSSPEILRHLEELKDLADLSDAIGIKKKLYEIVPEYCPELEHDVDYRPRMRGGSEIDKVRS